MLIFFISFVFLIVGIIVYKLGYDYEIFGGVLAVVGGAALLVSLTALPTNILTIRSEIEQFKITKATYENARNNFDSLSFVENAAIQVDIAHLNRWLVDTQYFNETVFDIFIPDEIMDLKPLK